MSEHVLIWDLETIPDISAVVRVNGLGEGDEAGARAVLGVNFPKLIFHKVACIGALIAQRADDGWRIRSLGAPHLGERSETELLQSFVDKIGSLRPQLVTFNGSSFDLPVLRYRSMINRVTAPGLEMRRYFNRYSDDALDLCDALASFDARAKTSLNDLCRALGFPGKPDDIDGSQVDQYVQEGRIGEVAAYCETDVVNTYRVWLVHELFRGRLSDAEFQASEANLLGYIQERCETKPHLAYLMGAQSPTEVHDQTPIIVKPKADRSDKRQELDGFPLLTPDALEYLQALDSGTIDATTQEDIAFLRTVRTNAAPINELHRQYVEMRRRQYVQEANQQRKAELQEIDHFPPGMIQRPISGDVARSWDSAEENMKSAGLWK